MAIDYDGGLTIAMSVTDRKKSIAWYTDVLGFELLYDVEEIGWCELKSPVDRVNIGLGDSGELKVGSGPVPTFGVKDIDKARAELESKGVRFDGETRVIPDMVKLATFFDPDGNPFMLFQDLSGQES